MKNLLVITHGTHCDRVLLQTILKPLRKRFRIVALTSSADDSFDEGDIVFHHHAPQWTTKDASLEFADGLKNLTWTALQHPVQASLMRWHRDVRALYTTHISKHEVSRVLVWYPAITLFISISEFLLQLPVYVLYCAPAYCNNAIPWLFDSHYRNKKFEMYTSHDNTIINSSWLTQLQRWSMLTSSNVVNVLSKVRIIRMWDKFQIFRNIVPLLNNTVHDVGAWRTPLKSYWRDVPTHISEFIHCRRHNLIFMSFGTYAENAYITSVMQKLQPALRQYCDRVDAGVLFHNGHHRYDCDWLRTFRGFIPYEYIVPKCRLVIFTGSVCLQNVCILAKTRMLFVPVLAEQHFWAKNYKFFTDVDYIVDSSSKTADIVNAMTSKKALRWIRKICNHMNATPPPQDVIPKLFVDV